jgi:ATP-binding cassette subfamily C protein LapB
MDAQSEAGLISRLAPALEGRTLLLISHRPAVLRLVNRLVVMADGKVALDGPRDAVLKRLAGQAAPPSQSVQAAGPAA